MSPIKEFWKVPGDEFWIAVDFSTWPLQPGETVVSSNTRGSLAVVALDGDGNDVSAEVIEGSPVIGPNALRVMAFIFGGTVGADYFLRFTAPTSDGELLNAVHRLNVNAH